MTSTATAGRWRVAMERALYGADGFFTRPGPGPAAHFRTSAHASPLFAGALATLLSRIDHALGRPARLDVVDIGAGRGELLTTLAAATEPELRKRLSLHAVERAGRPGGLAGGIEWHDEPPRDVVGLVIATEWLDNVPLDIAQNGRYLEVDPSTGDESVGGPVSPADAEWLDRWWPATGPDDRAEIGTPRDAAWAAAVATLRDGLAVAVDYGHLRDARPAFGTLSGFRDGREVAPVPDGSCDLTVHVAVDACAVAGGDVAAVPPKLFRQREALLALGLSGARPPLDLARSDPAGYLRRLASASAAAELTDPTGLGGHWWLLQPASGACAALADL
jgi:SAM-dependent MidA family methyltransferase